MRLGRAALTYLGLAALAACGTTRSFTVESNAASALVSARRGDGRDAFPVHAERKGVTPATVELTFPNEKAVYELWAEKRGYAAGTSTVTQTSEPHVHLELKRIEGVPDQVFAREKLASGGFLVLPVSLEVLIHSGVGRLDKTERSAEASQRVAESLETQLAAALEGNARTRRMSPDAAQTRTWGAMAPDLERYLATLDGHRLPYSSLPPYVNGAVPGFAAWTEGARHQGGGSYLLFARARCVSETGGRKVGNVLLSILGAASRGAARGAYGRSIGYYDPSAFAPDSGTLLTVYVIDADTSEVLAIDQRVFDDVTDADELKSLAKFLAGFPPADAVARPGATM